jgi:hypothetical protein
MTDNITSKIENIFLFANSHLHHYPCRLGKTCIGSVVFGQIAPAKAQHSTVFTIPLLPYSSIFIYYTILGRRLQYPLRGCHPLLTTKRWLNGYSLFGSGSSGLGDKGMNPIRGALAYLPDVEMS